MAFFRSRSDLRPDESALLRRIVAGKAAGLIFGLLGFFALPFFAPDAGTLFRWGVLLWYPTVGAFIALGIGLRHPLLHWQIPPWLLGAWIGAWMNFVLVFFCYDKVAEIMTDAAATSAAWLADPFWLSSPFWFALEGAIVGAIIALAAAALGKPKPPAAG
jgi:hypothetical protein